MSVTLIGVDVRLMEFQDNYGTGKGEIGVDGRQLT